LGADFGGGGLADEQRAAIASVQGLLSLSSAQGGEVGTVGGRRLAARWEAA
jgi:hypothetical protein